jgi:hypothetical protein
MCPGLITRLFLNAFAQASNFLLKLLSTWVILKAKLQLFRAFYDSQRSYFDYLVFFCVFLFRVDIMSIIFLKCCISIKPFDFLISLTLN